MPQIIYWNVTMIDCVENHGMLITVDYDHELSDVLPKVLDPYIGITSFYMDAHVLFRIYKFNVRRVALYIESQLF